jgi:hypothetical protein
LLAWSGSVCAYDEEGAVWREDEIVFPELPAPEKMKPFFVSAAASNRFLLDPASLSVGGDGVVRYVLLVETPGGARNMTYEGMRCTTREKRIYASARRDGSWSRSRNEGWEKIRDIAPNRQHAALFLDYFCPGGVIVRDPDEVRDAINKGGHPSNKMW